MKRYQGKSFVTTAHERCRVCYTCVRECPAKAIRIVDGQAQIIDERCINCGNCVKVCSQGAKQVVKSIDIVRDILKNGRKSAALIAPSFPAEFDNTTPGQFVAMIRELGFDYVHEVAFGADLVADRYKQVLKDSGDEYLISTTCPAVNAYVEKYHPALIGNLAKIVSPMIAEARVVHEIYGDDINVVFIGPCIAKKAETVCDEVVGEVDSALTFLELRQMFTEDKINRNSVVESEFESPLAGSGALFPISRGMLQAAGIEEDIIDGEVLSTDGRSNFVEAIKEFENGECSARLLDLLCCNGCIMGAGMSPQPTKFRRRKRVSRYLSDHIAKRDMQTWRGAKADYADLDLDRGFTANDQRIPVESQDEIEKILKKMGKFSAYDELNCGACGYETCREHALAIYKGLAENEMCLPYTIEKLRQTITDLNLSNEQLADTREALEHSEKLASMGQLAAGIAHEVNNPLGVVLMYSHILLDEFGKDERLKDDLSLIAEQADRCKKIVSGLLGFARQNKVVLEKTNVFELIDRFMLTAPPPDTITVDITRETDNPFAEIDRDQIVQVLTNLVTNAYAAMENGGKLSITITGDERSIILLIGDSGVGIPKDNIEKIFEPFFSTKQLGMGTGLGLAVTYGIVKMHFGDIKVESNDDPSQGPTGTSFRVRLPRIGKQD